MIFWSTFNVLLFVYCIRPVSDVPNLRQVISLTWFLESLFKRRATSRNSPRIFSYMWPASRQAPKKQDEYLYQISNFSKHWEQETEVRELLSTLATLHLLISRKMNWYSSAVLATRVQVFTTILFLFFVFFAIT